MQIRSIRCATVWIRIIPAVKLVYENPSSVEIVGRLQQRRDGSCGTVPERRNGLRRIGISSTFPAWKRSFSSFTLVLGLKGGGVGGEGGDGGDGGGCGYSLRHHHKREALLVDSNGVGVK